MITSGVKLRMDRRGGGVSDQNSPSSSRSASRDSRMTQSVAVETPTATVAMETPTATVSTPGSSKELTEKEIEKKTKSIIEEYLHLNDIQVL